MIIFNKYIISLFVVLSILRAQGQNTDYKVLIQQKTDSLIKVDTLGYETIDATYKRFTKDSLAMDFLNTYGKKEAMVLIESYALNALGIHCRNTSQYKAAIDFHQRSLQKAIQIDNVELRVIGLNMLGVVHRRMDAVQTALDYHYKAITLAESVKTPNESIKRSIAVSLNSMGNIFLALNQYELAIQKFNTSLGIEKSVNNQLGLAINYHNIGYAKEALGRLDEALEDYKISLSYNQAINSSLGQVICNNSIAHIYIEQGKYEAAIQTILTSLDKAKALRDKFHLVGLYNNLGLAYLKIQDYKHSHEYLDIALDIATAHNFKSAIANAYKYLSLLAELEKKFGIALQYYKKYEAFEEQVRNEKNFQYVNDLIVKYDTENISNQVEELSKENEATRDKLERNKIIWIISLVLLGVLLLLIYILNRQHMLKNEKKILTLEQEVLRSQMNPHFVFNSLNSIKHFIISNEKESAVHYLNKFAKLIRKILEVSMVKEVTLDEEIETMKLYMSIENIRMSNEIEFNIRIEDNLDTEAIKIPSLILQPFLENAIWHGLSSKEGAKIIELSIHQNNIDFVDITITDNGIGRKKALEIKDRKSLNRKSVGVSLSMNRLENYTRTLSNTHSLQFVDLEKDGVPIGTKVELKIPLK